MSQSRGDRLMLNCALAILVQALPLATADAKSESSLSSNLGDVNCDGITDLLDVVLLGNHLDGLIALPDSCDDNVGDVNLDGIVNEGDYTYLLGIICFIPTSIKLQSDPNDFIGGGGSYAYTQADAVLTFSAFGGTLHLNVTGDQTWAADFQVPDSLSQLVPGTFSNLTRYPFNDPAMGGLDWYGEGHGCNTLTGSFVIERAVYRNGSLALFDLNFEQHCESQPDALRGTIHWDVDDPTVPPGPVVPIPSGLWGPAPGSVPTSGSYMYIESDPGDLIGLGQTLTYTPSNSTFGAWDVAGHFYVQVFGLPGDFWFANFKPMVTLSDLQLGYYPDVRRYPFHNPAKGGLDISGQGRGCNRLTGWFTVDAITYVGGQLTSIDLRFEQHCESAAPSLRGAIHWEQ